MTNKGKLFSAFLLMVFSICALFPVTVMGSDVVSASVTLFDSTAKTIVVTVSENIDGSVGNVRLYNTESGETVQATAQIEGLNKIKISFEQALAELTEYAVVFENDIYGTSGNALESRYVYFTTDGGNVPDEFTLFDYDNKATTAGSNAVADKWVKAYADTEHGYALQAKAYNVNADMDNDLGGITYYSSDKWSFGFDVKIVKNPASFAVLLFGESGGVPAGFGFAKGRAMFSVNKWWDKNQLSTDVDRWFASEIIADYRVGEWVNYKVVYDKGTNTFSVYEDNMLKFNVQAASQFNKLTNVRISLRNQNNSPAIDETMLWIDNVRVEKFPNACKVENIRITDLSGQTVAAPQPVKRDIDKIEIGFLCDVEKTTLTTNTLKLKYNDEEIAYGVVETQSDKSYCIKPAKLPQDGDTVTVLIMGAKDKSGNTLTDYSSRVIVNDDDTSFKVAAPVLVNADGNAAVLTGGNEIYLETMLANKSAVDKSVMLFIMGYTADNSLEVFKCSKIDVPANRAVVVDEVQNSVKVTLPQDKEIKYVIGTIDNLADGILTPLTESAILE